MEVRVGLSDGGAVSGDERDGGQEGQRCEGGTPLITGAGGGGGGDGVGVAFGFTIAAMLVPMIERVRTWRWVGVAGRIDSCGLHERAEGGA